MKSAKYLSHRIVPVIIILILLLSGLLALTMNTQAAAYNSAYKAKKKQIHLVINEFYSYGTADKEWVEIYNPEPYTVNFTALKLSDQDGHVVNISAANVTHLPAHYYILVHMGKGHNQTSFHNHTITLYAQFGKKNDEDILNDDGDDLLLYNGTIGSKDCDYIDYVAYYNGGKNMDIDQPPIDSGLKFTLDGRGTFGYIPAPGPNESASLIPNGDDTNSAQNWYITRNRRSASGTTFVDSITPGSENVNILRVTAQDISPKYITQGNSSLMLKLTLYGMGVTSEYMKPMDMIIGIDGTLDPTDVEKVILYTEHMNPLDSGPFGPNKKVVLGSFNYGIRVGESQTYYIALKLKSNAHIYQNFSIQVLDFDMQPRSWDQQHNDEVFFPQPITTNSTFVMPKDLAPPHVTKVIYDTNHPFGPGKHSVTVYFNESMNTTYLPNVTYGVYGYEYPIRGGWINGTVWQGEFNVDPQGPNGKLKLDINGARDTSLNLMVPFTTNLTVDTQKPYIENIKYSALPPYPAFMPVNITITFSENVSGINAMIKDGKHVVYVANVYHVNRTTYMISFNTQSWKTGIYTLWIYNATDIAGNVMKDFESNFTVDTSLPVISYVSYKMSAVEGDNVSFSVYATDNVGVKRVWAVYYYKDERVVVEGVKAGDHWVFQVMGGAVVPPTTTITIFVQDYAGNVYKEEDTISVIPWWQAMWWIWVILAIIFGFIVLLIYDAIRRRKLKEQLGEELVAESLLSRMTKIRKNKPKKKKAPKKKKKKEEPEESEEEEEEYYMPPPQIPADVPVMDSSFENPEEEKPYEDEYFDEETIEREE